MPNEINFHLSKVCNYQTEDMTELFKHSKQICYENLTTNDLDVGTRAVQASRQEPISAEKPEKTQYIKSGLEFNCPMTTRIPEQSSSGTQKLRCNKCDYFTYYNNLLDEHIAEYHVERQIEDRSHPVIVQCPSCPFTTRDHRRLDLHSRFCSNRGEDSEKVPNCPHCNFKSKYGGKLSTHLTNNHGNVNDILVVANNTTVRITSDFSLPESASISSTNKSNSISSLAERISVNNTAETSTDESNIISSKAEHILTESATLASNLIESELVSVTAVSNLTESDSTWNTAEANLTENYAVSNTAESYLVECDSIDKISESNITENDSTSDRGITEAVINIAAVNEPISINEENKESVTLKAQTHPSNQKLDHNRKITKLVCCTICKFETRSIYKVALHFRSVHFNQTLNAKLQVDPDKEFEDKPSNIMEEFSINYDHADISENSESETSTEDPNTVNITADINPVGSLNKFDSFHPDYNTTNDTFKEPGQEFHDEIILPQPTKKIKLNIISTNTNENLAKYYLPNDVDEIILDKEKKYFFENKNPEHGNSCQLQTETQSEPENVEEKIEIQQPEITENAKFQLSTKAIAKEPKPELIVCNEEEDCPQTAELPQIIKNGTKTNSVKRRSKAKIYFLDQKKTKPTENENVTVNENCSLPEKETETRPHYSTEKPEEKIMESIKNSENKLKSKEQRYKNPSTSEKEINTTQIDSIEKSNIKSNEFIANYQQKDELIDKLLPILNNVSNKIEKTVSIEKSEIKNNDLVEKNSQNSSLTAGLLTVITDSPQKNINSSEINQQISKSIKNEEIKSEIFKNLSLQQKLAFIQQFANKQLGNKTIGDIPEDSVNMDIDKISPSIVTKIPQKCASKRKETNQTKQGKQKQSKLTGDILANQVDVKDKVMVKMYAVESTVDNDDDKTQTPRIKLTFKKIVEEVNQKTGRNSRKKINSRSRKRTISCKIKDFNSCPQCNKFKSKSLKRLYNHVATKHKISSRSKSSCSTSNARIQKQEDKQQEHSKEEVNIKQKSVNNKNIVLLQCQFCPYKNISQKRFQTHNLSKHMGRLRKLSQTATIENGKSELQCPNCNYETNSPKRLQTHREKKHIDNETFSNDTNSNSNKSITSQKPLNMEHKEKLNDVKSSLQHFSTLNLPGQNSQTIKKAKKTKEEFQCSVCKFQTTSQKCLKNHEVSKHKKIVGETSENSLGVTSGKQTVNFDRQRNKTHKKIPEKF
jgi:hypothetical protein